MTEEERARWAYSDWSYEAAKSAKRLYHEEAAGYRGPSLLKLHQAAERRARVKRFLDRLWRMIWPESKAK